MFIGAKKRNVEKIEMGDNAKPVIFTHVGVGDNSSDIQQAIKNEIKKAKSAISLGSKIICDVSLCENIALVQEKIMQSIQVPFACVPIYETYIEAEKMRDRITASYFIDKIKQVILRGVDVITLHATVFLDDESLIKNSKRIIPTTSRGGVMMLEMMKKYGIENPYYTHFEEILSLCVEHDVSISLGPMYRPASIVDCKIDDLHLVELKRMGVLCKKAQKKGVNIMVEGIGHAPINIIEKMVKKTKRICHNAPYRCMAVSTDIAIGYDHVSSAIAHANAIYHGADSVTVVTRSEHLGIPNLQEVEEGVKSAVVAVYSGYIARTGDFSRDKRMSCSRKNSGCVGDIDSTLFPKQVQKQVDKKGEKCTMCGKYCPLSARNKQDGIF